MAKISESHVTVWAAAAAAYISLGGGDNVMEWVGVGGGKVQLFISHPHIQNKSTKRSEHEMDMIRKSAAATKLKHCCCLVKIPVRIFSLPRHLPAKKFFLHFSSFPLCFLAASASSNFEFFYTQPNQPTGKKKHQQQHQHQYSGKKTNSSKEVKRGRGDNV